MVAYANERNDTDTYVYLFGSRSAASTDAWNVALRTKPPFREKAVRE